jgi:hypothetical protein
LPGIPLSMPINETLETIEIVSEWNRRLSLFLEMQKFFKAISAAFHNLLAWWFHYDFAEIKRLKTGKNSTRRTSHSKRTKANDLIKIVSTLIIKYIFCSPKAHHLPFHLHFFSVIDIDTGLWNLQLAVGRWCWSSAVWTDSERC